MDLKANCKINLGLRVVRRRTDGFHDIETVMVPVKGLFDTVSVTALADADTYQPYTPLPYPPAPAVFPTDSVLVVSGTQLDCAPENNICMRALRLLQREFGIGEALVKLHKVIPTGAGLGGGSSDGAFALRALNEEFALELTDTELEHFAAELGSDVPFFIRNTPQLCTGRGEIMTPVEVDLAGKWIVMLKPAVAVSTAEAYAGVTPREADHRSARNGRNMDEAAPLPEILGRPVHEWREWLVNDFEASVFARYPQICALKEVLYDTGALYASMSGSGSAVFGIFEGKPTTMLHRNPALFDRRDLFAYTGQMA